MVEVTRYNFDTTVSEIEESFKEACFFAVDTEFTGLVVDSESAPSLFDSAESRYAKLKKSVSNFIICQFGLSVFRKCQRTNKYFAKTFLFHLCPASCGHRDPVFMFQTSSLEFLCQNQFDFNKCFYEGVTYLRKTDEECLRHTFTSDGEIYSTYFNTGQVENILASILQWAKSPKSEQLTVDVPPGVNAALLMAKIIHSCGCKIWPTLEEGKIVVHRISKEQREEKLEDFQDWLLESLKGFTRIFQIMVSSKKPLVGHNLFMDLMLMYSQFYKSLPVSYKEFKSSLHELFPTVFDTKHIAWSVKNIKKYREVMGKCDLYTLYLNLVEGKVPLVYLFPPLIVQENNLNEKPHEASFDSYASGVIFIKLAHVLATDRLLENNFPEKEFTWKHLAEEVTEVTDFKNRVNVIRAQVHHIKLDGEDPKSDRPHLVFVETKDETSVPLDIIKDLISKCGATEILEVSKCSVIVAAGSFGCARKVIAELSQYDSIKVTQYHSFFHSPKVRKMLWYLLLMSAGACLVTFSSMLKPRYH